MHGGRCGICCEFIEGDFHVDHVIPLARGGQHGYVNVQPAHPRCNLVKGAHVPEAA
jgi:5-methylcytosine-specific restriction endonuclease McrA